MGRSHALHRCCVAEHIVKTKHEAQVPAKQSAIVAKASHSYKIPTGTTPNHLSAPIATRPLKFKSKYINPPEAQGISEPLAHQVATLKPQPT